MKRIYCISMLLCSLLIIYVGAGVAIIQYCCADCEILQKHSIGKHSCCPGGQDEMSGTFHPVCESCLEGSCSSVIYKIDLIKHSPEKISEPTLIQLPDRILPDFTFSSLFLAKSGFLSYLPPPYYKTSRHYLSLYTVLLI